MTTLEFLQLGAQKLSIAANNTAAKIAKVDQDITRAKLTRTQKKLARLRNKLVQPLPEYIG